MRRALFIAANLLALSISFLGTTRAQQAAGPASQQTPTAKDAKPPAANSQTTPRKKLAAAPATQTQKPQTLDTQKDKEKLRDRHEFGLDPAPAVCRSGPRHPGESVEDSLAGSKTLLTEDEQRAVLTALRAEVRKKQEGKMAQAEEATRKRSGILGRQQIKGRHSHATQRTSVQDSAGWHRSEAHHRGLRCLQLSWHAPQRHGIRQFLQTRPARNLSVSGVIKGWTEALQLMPVGSKCNCSFPPTSPMARAAPARHRSQLHFNF